MKGIIATAILVAGFLPTVASQIVGDCPAANLDHPIWVKNVEGVLTDETGAVIPKVRMVLQARRGKGFTEAEAFPTDEAGKFVSRAHQTGEYRLLITGPKGFCSLSLPAWISQKGWARFKVVLPVGMTDTCAGDCEKRARVEEIKPTF